MKPFLQTNGPTISQDLFFTLTWHGLVEGNGRPKTVSTFSTSFPVTFRTSGSCPYGNRVRFSSYFWVLSEDCLTDIENQGVADDTDGGSESDEESEWRLRSGQFCYLMVLQVKCYCMCSVLKCHWFGVMWEFVDTDPLYQTVPKRDIINSIVIVSEEWLRVCVSNIVKRGLRLFSFVVYLMQIDFSDLCPKRKFCCFFPFTYFVGWN